MRIKPMADFVSDTENTTKGPQDLERDCESYDQDN